MKTNQNYNRNKKTTGIYVKIAKGVYQKASRTFMAIKCRNGVISKVKCTSKSAALKAYKTL